MIIKEVTKQSRPKRKYLGTLDPETEIASLQSEVKKLRAVVRSYEKVCASIADALGKAPRDL